MLVFVSQNIDITSLLRILSNTVSVVVHRLRRIRGVSGDWWRKVVLEEKVVLVGCASNATEDVALHELLDVGAEAVNNVVVIPKVELGDLAIHTSERLGVVPADVVGKVIVVALLSELFWEWILATLSWVVDLSPWSKWSVDTDTVVIGLITTTKPIIILVSSL